MMRRLSFEKLEISPEHKQVLEKTTITESGPGTILNDFQILLNYLRKQGLPVAGPHRLPRTVLGEINALLSHPIQLRLKRPEQKSYPHIQGLYLLLRASGLACIKAKVVDSTLRDGKLFLSVEDKAYQVWESLNPTERYCALLESWLLRGKEEIVGERGGGLFSVPNILRGVMDLIRRTPEKGLRVEGDKNAQYLLRYVPGWHNLGLMELFGLISIKPGSPIEGQGWQIESIDRTAFGDALVALLCAKVLWEPNLLFESEKEGRVPVGLLQPILQPYFPEWKKNLSIPEWVFREGTYIFRVTLGRLWFRIAIPASHTLEWLASTILTAIKFDSDHLYHFEYENPWGAIERINHDFIDEGPWASDVRVGDVPLRVGQKMTYLYDFGDNWEFEVTLEQVDRAEAVKKPRILEMHGSPPKQYSRWDE
ncbi:MAG: plasmid pRiA4b ORF-3 family protein [Deltaproteobacteria bacterium]|nr:plasmid pRiA4b ORF-3 family protein [Deltaproteobacteria bacterium]